MLPSDPDEMNDDRARAAGVALRAFAFEMGELDGLDGLGREAQNNLDDLITDLAHFCDRRGINLAKAISQAESLYQEETDGQGSQFAS